MKNSFVKLKAEQVTEAYDSVLEDLNNKIEDLEAIYLDRYMSIPCRISEDSKWYCKKWRPMTQEEAEKVLKGNTYYLHLNDDGTFYRDGQLRYLQGMVKDLIDRKQTFSKLGNNNVYISLDRFKDIEDHIGIL